MPASEVGTPRIVRPHLKSYPGVKNTVGYLLRDYQPSDRQFTDADRVVSQMVRRELYPLAGAVAFSLNGGEDRVDVDFSATGSGDKRLMMGLSVSGNSGDGVFRPRTQGVLILGRNGIHRIMTGQESNDAHPVNPDDVSKVLKLHGLLQEILGKEKIAMVVPPHNPLRESAFDLLFYHRPRRLLQLGEVPLGTGISTSPEQFTEPVHQLFEALADSFARTSQSLSDGTQVRYLPQVKLLDGKQFAQVEPSLRQGAEGKIVRLDLVAGNMATGAAIKREHIDLGEAHIMRKNLSLRDGEVEVSSPYHQEVVDIGNIGKDLAVLYRMSDLRRNVMSQRNSISNRISKRH